MPLFRNLVLGWLVLVTVPPSAHAAEVGGVLFPERHRMGDTVLELSGVGLLHYKVLFKAYAAALYLGEGVRPEAVLDDVPRRLEIEYFWPIPTEALVRATREGIARNIEPEELDPLHERIDRLCTFYEDVEPGDRYSLTYLPGVGTELALNDEPLGSIPGADFAAALFAIWLGDRPLDGPLREQLLASR